MRKVETSHFSQKGRSDPDQRCDQKFAGLDFIGWFFGTSIAR